MGGCSGVASIRLLPVSTHAQMNAVEVCCVQGYNGFRSASLSHAGQAGVAAQ